MALTLRSPRVAAARHVQVACRRERRRGLGNDAVSSAVRDATAPDARRA